MKHVNKSLCCLIIFFVTGVLTGCQGLKGQQPLETKDKDLQEVLGNETDELDHSNFNKVLNKARKSWSEGKKELAQAFYISAYKQQPKNVMVLEEMAEIYLLLGKKDLEMVCYKLILEQQPENNVIRERYGLLLIKHKELIEAEQALKKVVATQESWRAFNGLGIIADIQGNHDDARLFFGKAIKISPKNPEIINNIGYSLYMDDQMEKAQSYFLWAIKEKKDFNRAIYNYALTLARQKHYVEALSTFGRVMPHSEANNNIGYIAMKNGDFDKAESYFRRAIQLSPQFYQKAYSNLHTLRKLKDNSNSEERMQ